MISGARTRDTCMAGESYRCSIKAQRPFFVDNPPPPPLLPHTSSRSMNKQFLPNINQRRRRSPGWILLHVVFCTIMAISWQNEARSRVYALLLFRRTSRVLYSAQYHRQHCTHSRPLNSLGHCICTATVTNIRPDRDSSKVSRLQAQVCTNQPSGQLRGRWTSTWIKKQSVILKNTGRWSDYGLMLARRLRRWPNIKT